MPPRDVQRVLSLPIFNDIDQNDFPDDRKLIDIIANDGRIVRYARGDIIVGKGDYGNSLFVILDGSVRGLTSTRGASSEDQDAARARMPWLQSLAQLWRNSKIPESRDLTTSDGRSRDVDQQVRFRSDPDISVTIHRSGSERPTADDDKARIASMDASGPDERDERTSEHGQVESIVPRIDDVDGVIRQFRTFVLGRHKMFGELAALARGPRTNTLFADEETELLELRWQGLREIQKWSDSFDAYILEQYRERALLARLGQSSLFAKLDKHALEIIAEQSVFETHGEFEWTDRYQDNVTNGTSGEQVIEHEPIISEQDHYLNGMLLIHSGFARVSEKFDHGEKTIGYLSKDDVFGLEEIVDSVRDDGPRRLRYSLRAIGYVAVIRIPTQIVETYILPTLPQSAQHRLFAPMAQKPRAPRPGIEDATLQQSMLDFLVDNRFINGTRAMAINTDRCVNCDDCVRACATAHDNNPRFVRHGMSYQNLMIANACMHCRDPVCLIGCPTGAIHRDIDTGCVVIDDATCVGCEKCANSCPYDNIRMVEIRDPSGAFLADAEGVAILKATKCDFCAGQLGGPACQRACPHDALRRVDIRNTDELIDWLA